MAQALGAAILLAACSPADDAAPPAASATTAETPASDPSTTPEERPPVAVTGEWLVKFEPRAAIAGRAKLVASLPARVKRSYHTVPGLQLVEAKDGADLDALRDALAMLDGVEYVEPNLVYRALVLPNDPEFGRQRGLHNTGQFQEQPPVIMPDIEAPAAWDITTGADDIVVAVIDSGVDYTHEDLVANIFRNESECIADGIDSDGNGYVDDCHGIDTANHDSDPMDDAGHGTHVAGILGAVGNNGIGIAGVAWRVKILPCKFLSVEGHGTTADAIECLEYVARMKDRGVNAVATNNSWGNMLPSRALEDAIGAQRARGILFVAAAGNEQENNDLVPQYPCNVDRANVICVADAYDQVVIYSNWGAATVHLGAPGTSVLSTYPGNRYEMRDGTSMATPHVTGALVLLKAQEPNRDWRALKNLVMTGTQPPTFGQLRMTVTNGRLDAARALRCTDATVKARLRPTLLVPVARPARAPVTLKALHVRCATPNGPVTVEVSPGGEVITLLDDGQGEDEAAGDGIYSGHWMTPEQGSFTLKFDTPEQDEFIVHVDPQLRSGFPLPTFSYPDSYDILPEPDALVVGNIAGDESLEILASSYDYGPLEAWHHDGRKVVGWPSFDAGGGSTVSLGEFDGDPRGLEIAEMTWLHGARVFRGDGTALAGWPRRSTSLHTGRAPATFDFDHDGIDELLTIPARRADGTTLTEVTSFPVVGTAVHSAPAVADLDADGEPEVILVDASQVWASNRQGRFNGFPVSRASTSYVVLPQPVVGDVTGDGAPDIVVMSLQYGSPLHRMQVDVLDVRGRPQHSWSFEGNASGLSPSLADLTGDGIPEIVFHDGSRGYAWTGSGQSLPGWPVALDANYLGAAQPVIGDLDGDQKPDVVFVRGRGTEARGSVQAFNRLGVPLGGYPKTLWSASHPATPVIADLDRDGRNELVVAAMPDYGLRDGIHVYGNASAGVDGPIEWGQFMERAARHGYYRLGQTLASESFVATRVFGAGRVTSGDGAIDCGERCLKRYGNGTPIVLTASAGAGARFVGWRGACTGTATSCSTTVTQLTEVSADFDAPLTVSLGGAGSGTVTSSTGNLSCPGRCSVVLAPRTAVTLTASAAPGSAFDGWEGACQGTQLTCELFMDEATAVTARFGNARGLTVGATGPGRGRITTADGMIDCGTRCTANFTPGSTVRLLAQPDADSYVTTWSRLGCGYEALYCDVPIEGDQSVTVRFERRPVLTVTKSGAGSAHVTTSPAAIDCGATCSAPVPHDTTIVIRAVPADDSYVVGFSSGCTFGQRSTNCDFYSGTTSRTIDVVTALKSKVNVSLSGDGTGAVSSLSDTWSCNSNCSKLVDPRLPHRITVHPGGDSTFAGWGGACSGQQFTCTVDVTTDKTVIATFNKLPSTGPGPGTGGGGSGSGSGGGGGGSSDAVGGLLGLLLLARRVRRRR